MTTKNESLAESSPRREFRFSPLAKRLTVFILLGLVVVLVLHTAEVLPPFVWAVVTAFVLNGPIIQLMHRFGLPRWAWITAFFVAFFALLMVLILLMVPTIVKEARTLSTDIPIIKQEVDDYLNNNDTIQIVGIEIPTDTARNSLDEVIKRLPTLAEDLGPKLLKGTFRFLIDFLLYIVVTFYLMLMGGRPIWRFIDSLPLTYRGEMRALFSRIMRVLGAYIKGQFLLIAIMAGASFVFLTIFGIRYSLILALMVGVLELVPFIGPYLAISICCLVTYFQPHGPGLSFGLGAIPLTILIAIILFTLRQIEDYLIIPNLIGRIVELPALLIIVTIVVAAAVLGPMGLLLGVPVVAVIRIVVRYLYFKLVHADRTKLHTPSETSFEELYQTLEKEPDSGRVLLMVEPPAPYLKDFDKLNQIKQLSHQKFLDIAFCMDLEENIKTANMMRKAGFTIVDQEQLIVAKD